MTAPPSLPREIGAGVFWLGACQVYPANGIHAHLSCFLVVGDAGVALVDTGSPPHWQELERQLEHVLGRRRVDFLLPSHPEFQHIGNMPRLLDRFPDAVVVGEVRNYHLYYPRYEDRLQARPVGEHVDLGNRKLLLLDGVIKDLPNTVWFFDDLAKALFPSDGFSFIHYHLAGQCALTAEELPEPPSVEDVAFATRIIFPWAQYTDTGLHFGRLTDLLERYEVRMVAPAHGNVVTDLPRLLPIIRESLGAESAATA
jgi:flavorubredoxin